MKIITYLFPLFLLASACSAVCCSNKAVWCIILGTNCQPNCEDGHSYCNLAVEVCKNDNVGGCISIVTQTATVIQFTPISTVTDYTSTVQQASATVTQIVSVTVTSVYSTTFTEVVTQV